MRKNYDCKICRWRNRLNDSRQCSVLLNEPVGPDCPRFDPEQQHGPNPDNDKIRASAERRLAAIRAEYAEVLEDVDDATWRQLVEETVSFSDRGRSARSGVRRARGMSAADIIMTCGECGHEGTLEEMSSGGSARCYSCGSNNLSLRRT